MVRPMEDGPSPLRQGLEGRLVPGKRSLARSTAQRGAVPVWVPLLLLFGGIVLGLRVLQRDARQRGVAQIDVTRYRLMAESQWLSAAWTDELERILVEVRSLPVDDLAVLDQFVAEVSALPFVAKVGQYSVQWPDGLILPIKLREPVACIRTGGRDFLPVSADGVVLGGYTYSPHEAYGGWLPTLCLLYTSPSPRDRTRSRMPSSA